MSTKIEWTNETWNPIIGCSPVSPGCKNCYAEKMAFRLGSMKLERCISALNYSVVVNWKTKKWNGKTQFVSQAIEKPLSWRKPRMIFVCSMGDLFHESVPFEWIDKVMAVIACTPQHTYQILTKRPHRMAEYFNQGKEMLIARWEDAVYELGLCDKNDDPDAAACHVNNRADREWPLKNIWLGVTAENQEMVNKRVPFLLNIPAAIRFVSVEPMLGAVDLSIYMATGWTEPPYDDIINWVICGGESGINARPVNHNWVENLKNQCNKYETCLFFKQWGEWIPVNEVPKSWGNQADLKGTHRWVNEIDGKDTGTRPGHMTIRVGKKKAGCTLNGKEYKQFPNTATV
ncbi:MAG: phage Gp37/Gp68 family protein [Salinivirgaceae bacterium]